MVYDIIDQSKQFMRDSSRMTCIMEREYFTRNLQNATSREHSKKIKRKLGSRYFPTETSMKESTKMIDSMVKDISEMEIFSSMSNNPISNCFQKEITLNSNRPTRIKVIIRNHTIKILKLLLILNQAIFMKDRDKDKEQKSILGELNMLVSFVTIKDMVKED